MIIGSNSFNPAQYLQRPTIAQQVANLSTGFQGGAVSRIPATMQQMLGSRQSAMGMEQMAMAQAFRQGAMQGVGMGGLPAGMMGGAGQSWEQVMGMAMAAEQQKQQAQAAGKGKKGKKGKCKKGKKGKGGGANDQAVIQARAQGIAQGLGMARGMQQMQQMQQQQQQQQVMQGALLAGILMS